VRRVLVEVRVVVDAGDLGGPLGERLAGGLLADGAGDALVDDVVDDAAELVDLLQAGRAARGRGTGTRT
jgi:hypothetical protein